MQPGEQVWVRAGRLGAVFVVLTVLAVGLVVAAAVALGQEQASDAAVLPVSVSAHAVLINLALVLGGVFFWLAALAGLAALQTALAMRVLGSPHADSRTMGWPLARASLQVAGPALARLIHVAPAPVIDRPHVDTVDFLEPVDSIAPAASTPTRLHCTVLVPAHNEEEVLGATLASLRAQLRRPDRIIVVADNCTDATATIAHEAGVDVMETVGNTEKKAGALNQALANLLPEIGEHAVVAVLDADSTINPEFISHALGLLETDPDLTAVGGLFFGEDGAGLIGQMQRNEFARYQRVVARKLNRVFVLTGTASLIRAEALRAVAAARGDLIPGAPGHVYDTLALTEDNELTLALKSLGAKLTSPPECRVTTEVMPTWRALWRQRLRWHRGALENIGIYGLTRATAPYWGQQIGLSYGVFALWSYIALMGISLLAADTILWSPFWVVVGLIFVLERMVTVWRIGWRGRITAMPIFLELIYAAFLQITFVTSIVQILTRHTSSWNSVTRDGRAAAALTVPYLVVNGILLPTTVLHSDWYAGLSVTVAINTLTFALLSLLQMLPPIRSWGRRSR